MKNETLTVFPLILMRVAGLPYTRLYPDISSHASDRWPEILDLAASLPRQTHIVQQAFDALLQTTREPDSRTAVFNARKAFFQKNKIPAPAFFGGYPSPELLNLQTEIETWKNLSAWPDLMNSWYQGKMEEEVAVIQAALTDKNFQHGLTFVSHDLLGQIPPFILTPVGSFQKKHRQILRSAYQYLTRATFKTSPLSRFTTVSLMRLDRTELSTGFEASKYSVNPNVAILPAIYEVLLQEPAFVQSLQIQLNPACKLINDKAEWIHFDGNMEAFQSIHANQAIRKIVDLLEAKGGQMPFVLLFESLERAFEVPKDDLKSYLENLVNYGMLCWRYPEQGTTPAWPSRLAQYLAHLPLQSNLFTEVAFLLQHLRVAAKSTVFQSVEDTMTTQKEASQAIQHFFTEKLSELPQIPPEHVFFEDVASESQLQLSQKDVALFCKDLATCWQKQPPVPMTGLRARLHAFAGSHMSPGQVLDFQEFCKIFMAWQPDEMASVSFKPNSKKLGALFQPFQADGKPRAVLNAMYPGGGKMYARWLSLFPADFQEKLQLWLGDETVVFPWHGWSNANFQPHFTQNGLLTPDGRVEGGRGNLRLAEIAVLQNSDGPQLYDPASTRTINLTDLGLEAPDNKPPVMQILWHLGVPAVSSSVFTTNRPMRAINDDILFMERVEYQSLVLARAAWRIPEGQFAKLQLDDPREKFYMEMRLRLEEIGVPRYFFARSIAGRHKPQFFDQYQVVSMWLFQKELQRNPGAWLLEEMLPTPEQWVVGASNEFAAEMAVEFDIS